MASGATRWVAIDWIKATAIIAVVANHAVRVWGPHVAAPDQLVRWLVQFHVPSFLLVSGFLYASPKAISVNTLRARLDRILIPYLVASVAFYIFQRPQPEVWSFLYSLATGSTLSIYYFVFLLTVFTLTTPAISRLPRPWLWGLLAGIWIFKISLAVHPSAGTALGYFWEMRNPLRTYDFFLLGWLCRLHWHELAPRLLQRERVFGIACCAGAILFPLLHTWQPALALRLDPSLRVLYTLGVCGLIAFAAHGRAPNLLVVSLSRCTYGIYLYHLAVVAWLQPLLDAYTPSVRIALLTLATVSVAFTASLGLKRVMPATARRVVGVG